jgi:predicted transcriptional regulator
MSSTPPNKKQRPGILARQRDGDQTLHPESCSAPDILLDEFQTVSHNGTGYSGMTMTENLRTERQKKANRIAVTANPFSPQNLAQYGITDEKGTFVIPPERWVEVMACLFDLSETAARLMLSLYGSKYEPKIYVHHTSVKDMAKATFQRALDELLTRGVLAASEEPHRYWASQFIHRVCQRRQVEVRYAKS